MARLEGVRFIKSLRLLLNLVAGARFELTTFRL